jgi:superfamily II DNA/RNA helicase
MKPETRSQRLLSITQSKAKMYEYNVPLEDHIEIPAGTNPDKLFPLSIGMLGDIASRINFGEEAAEEIIELRQSLPFSARFFDAFVQTRLNQKIDPYLLLLGSAAYYLCAFPGSSILLASRVDNGQLNLDGLGLENLLAWLLQGNMFNARSNIPPSLYKSAIETTWSNFQRFSDSGLQSQETIDAIGFLRSISYHQGTPRQLLFADLIGAIVRRKFENSTWNCLPKYTDLPVSEWFGAIRKTTFVREFWPAQHMLGEKGIFRGKSAIVQMPTSAGKTKATEIIIRSAFIANRTTLAVIIAPFRALCHEIRQGLLKAFHGEAIYVDELSDVLQMDLAIERIIAGKEVLVATPEKFNYVLRHEPDLAQRIGLIIYDEGHQFDSGTRGITYELLLTSLKAKIPDSAQTVLISAVISNAEQIGRWLIGDGVEVVEGLDLVPTFRTVGFATTRNPGRNLYFVNPRDLDESEFWVPRIFVDYELENERVFPDLSKGREIALFLGLKLSNQGSIAIFCGTKDAVSSICGTIVDAYEHGLPLPAPIEFANRVELLKLKYLHEVNLGSDSVMTKSAELGILAHHGSIPHGIRLSIEYAVKERLANFVVCTSTLAQGVNLPIRYLIVTSVYQGKQQIKVRDFQNLIGRSGRSGMHTEGSILFADPLVYDERNNRGFGRARWSKFKELLDPSRSEQCQSTLFSLFEPFEIELPRLVEIYLLEEDARNLAFEEIASQYEDDQTTLDRIFSLFAWKINIISAIESYLMANLNPDQAVFQREDVVSLSKGTLAYFLANDDQKKLIEDLFVLLAQNIEANIPEIPKRIVFGKTLYGVPDSIAISKWLDEHISELDSELDDLELFNILWPLLADNIRNKNFRNCDEPEVMKGLAIAWLEGKPFYDLFQTLGTAKLIAKTKRYKYKLENVVDICENGFAYDGILVLGALIELIPTLNIDNPDLLVTTLQRLQKRLKYGLPNQMAIILYELGFADRVVAIELSSGFSEIPTDKDLIIQALRSQREEVFVRLNQYPSYFSYVYQNVAT